MRTELTAEEIEAYREQGFVALPDFLDAGELAEWRSVVEGAVAERGYTRIPGFPDLDDPEVIAQMAEEHQQSVAYYQRVFTQRVNLWQTDDRMRRIILDPRLGRVAATLAGVEGVRIWHDQALIKEPFSNPTSFHLDVPYWSFTSADALSIWVALDDATLENGCLYYVPGSHKAEKFDNVGIGPEIGALFEVYPEWRDVAAVPCPVPAGGAIFHNGLTFHGAGANMTPGRRRAMTCGFMPDGSTFNGQPNILRPEYLATLAVGDLLDDEAQNPLVWSSTGVAAGR